MNVHSLSNAALIALAFGCPFACPVLLVLVPKLYLGTELSPQLCFDRRRHTCGPLAEAEAVQLPRELHSQVQLGNEGVGNEENSLYIQKNAATKTDRPKLE